MSGVVAASAARRVILVVAVIALGCASGVVPTQRGAFRLSEVADLGDDARRASLRYVIEGLRFDQAGDALRALGRYELALKVDPTNPYATLALARHHHELGTPMSTLSFLDQSAVQLQSQGLFSPRVRVHLVGMRGAAWYSSGQIEDGLAGLAEARELAPHVWDDGRLEARELF